MGGTVNTPICMPPTGRLGIAHVDGTTVETSGTIAMIRPRCSGSTLLRTVPRYFPKKRLAPRAPRSCSTSIMLTPSYRHLRERRDEPAAAQLEALLELAPLERAGDAVDEVDAVERHADPARGDQPPRLEKTAVADDVERALRAHRVVRLHGLGDPDHRRLHR